MSVTHLSVDRSLSDLWDFSTTIDLLGYDFMQQALLAMVLLGLGLSVVAMAVDPSLVDEAIQQAMDQNPSMAGEVTTDQVRIALFVVLAGFGLWALLAAGLAVLAWVGRSWAWVLLCISAGLSAGLFLAVTVLGAYVAVIALAATAGSLALLIRPEVREWYRR